MIAAFFDVEGTLYTANMWRGLVKYNSAHGRQNAARRYYLGLLPGYFLTKLHLVREESMRRRAIATMGSLLKGWTVEEGAAAYDWIIENHLLPTARSDVMARLEEHSQQGHAVVLVSGMPSLCLERLGAKLGAVGAVGTALDVRDGVYQGGVIPPVMIGEAKDRETRGYLQRKGITVDWSASYAYADSVHDESMLAMVGHPVAVYPDAGLLKLATSRGWTIIGEAAK
jgi:HAD superfamily hydrolase (TIGR01490 family)